MAGLQNDDEIISNSSDEIGVIEMTKPKKYVAVRGHTKTIGKKKVRVRPYLRKK